MRDNVVQETMRRWLADNRPVVLATVCRVRGSSSRPLGSRMVITSDDEFVGSVSGGCVEVDVYGCAQEVLRDRKPRILNYGPVSDPLLEVGLNCDGRIDVLLEYVDSELSKHLDPPEGSSLVTRYRRMGDHGRVEMSHYWELVVDGAWERPWYRAATEDGTEWAELVEPRMPKPLLLIVSAGPPAASLAVLGREMGYRVVVSDPREAYAQAESCPAAHEVVCRWPRDLPEVVGVGPGGLGPRCAVVSLNHEPRFEDDLFRALMDQPPVGYLGAIGKRQRHRERIERQEREGFDLGRLPTIHTPIGLDLGGKEPCDIALAIIAEIQAVRYGASGGFLSSSQPDAATLYTDYRKY